MLRATTSFHKLPSNLWICVAAWGAWAILEFRSQLSLSMSQLRLNLQLMELASNTQALESNTLLGEWKLARFEGATDMPQFGHVLTRLDRVVNHCAPSKRFYIVSGCQGGGAVTKPRITCEHDMSSFFFAKQSLQWRLHRILEHWIIVFFRASFWHLWLHQ